ncbi:phosphatase and actin regulator 2 [Trichonephila clavipes]|nr:phosphatase and actin regulator 2 [Trichonephila clavipes]
MSIILKDDIPVCVCQRARRLSCSEKLQCKKVNGAMKTSSVGSNSRSPTPSLMEGKHSRFTMLGREALQALEVETEEKSDRFEQTSRTLERKISMRSNKEELIKKGVLMPDGTDKDQDSKINDSVHQNHIPKINGFGPESGMSETEKQRNSPSVTYTSSSVQKPTTPLWLPTLDFLPFSSGLHEKKEISTTADSVRSGWPLWSRYPIEALNETKHAVFARRRS